MSQDNALLRIEYKLDLILNALQDKGIAISHLPQLSGIDEDSCPVCRSDIQVVVDSATETLQYSCGCMPPISVVKGISTLLDPPLESTRNSTQEQNDASTRAETNPIPSQSEERGSRRS